MSLQFDAFFPKNSNLSSKVSTFALTFWHMRIIWFIRILHSSYFGYLVAWINPFFSFNFQLFFFSMLSCISGCWRILENLLYVQDYKIYSSLLDRSLSAVRGAPCRWIVRTSSIKQLQNFRANWFLKIEIIFRNCIDNTIKLTFVYSWWFF